MAYSQTKSYELDKKMLEDEGLLRIAYKQCFGNFASYEDNFVKHVFGINNLEDSEKLSVSLGCSEFTDGSKRLTTMYSCKDKYNGWCTGSSFGFADIDNFQIDISNLNGSIFICRCVDPTAYDHSKRSSEIRIEIPEELILQNNEIFLLPKYILNEGIKEFVKHPQESFIKHIKAIKEETKKLIEEDVLKSM